MNMPDAWNGFLRTALCQPGLIGNVPLRTELLQIGDQTLPVTLNLDGAAHTSWVASLRNSYGLYARAETDLVGMPGALKPFYCAASYLAEGLLRAGGLHGGLYLNNWSIATNLYARTFDCTTVMQACQHLVGAVPRVPVVIRSLVGSLHQDLMHALLKEDFIFLPTRQVWLQRALASGAWRAHADVKKDLALARRESACCEWVRAADFSDADYARTTVLYDGLYRGRYPRHNPDYREGFFRAGVQAGWLRLYGLRVDAMPELAGIVGVIEREGVYATPVLGYDLNVPVKRGLYRQLMLKAFLEVEQSKGILHCSGGAGLFKQQRGARAEVEFAAVHIAHLRADQRACLRSLSGLLQRLAVPYLREHVL